MPKRVNLNYLPAILIKCWNHTRTNTEIRNLLKIRIDETSRLTAMLRKMSLLSTKVEEDARRRPNSTIKEKIISNVSEIIMLTEDEKEQLKVIVWDLECSSVNIKDIFDPKDKFLVSEKQISLLTIQIVLNFSIDYLMDLFSQIIQELNSINKKDQNDYSMFIIYFRLKMILEKSINEKESKNVDNLLRNGIDSLLNTPKEKFIWDLQNRISAALFYYSFIPQELGNPFDYKNIVN